MKHLFTHSARRIVLSYVIFSACWILFSDQLVFWLFKDAGAQHTAQTFKGWFFIAVTGALLYGLLQRTLRSIERITLEDSLCHLPNRLAFINETKKRCAHEQRAFFSLSLLDVDHFADINDSQGHGAGDRVITDLAACLQSALKEGWYIARLGGDEFGLLSPPASTQRELVAVLDALQTSIPQNSSLCRLTVSAGTSFYPEHGDTCRDLMRHADMALSSAKHQGRNRHYLFHDQLKQNLIDRLSLLEDLREACNTRAFSLVYQPQWSLTQQCWIGAEVLIRWHHPKRGAVPPDQFIPLAEREGLIHPITEFVLERALKELTTAGIGRQQLATLSLNLSHTVLINEAVMNRLQGRVHSHRDGQPDIIMEITETAAMENLEATLSAMEHWRAQGMRFSIDDFGTGYSSLARLKQLPLAELKIDRSFVQDLPEDVNDAVITQAILAMAKTLSLDVVAEGVETPEQAQFLKDNGCSVLQGYWLARPVPIGELTHILAHTIDL